MDEVKIGLLIKNIQAGERAGLDELWEGLTPRLFGYLLNTTRDAALAEDILQNTWLKAIQALPRFQPRVAGGFSGWLFTIARNELKQHWRKSSHELPFDPTQPEPSSQDHRIIQQQIAVEQALRQLKPDDQEILRLRYIADLPLTSIAQILQLNFVTVRVRIHRALARARTVLNS